MRREVVEISLFPTLAVVEATFDLYNEGPTVDLDVGFPCFRTQSPFKSHDTGLCDFAVFVADQRIPHTQKRLENVYYPMWYAWVQHVPAGQTIQLRVRYWVPLISYNMVSRMPFLYVLRTGRFWKGSIGEALIRVHATAIPLRAIQEATPPGYVLDPRRQTLTWHFKDLDPTDDIGILISPTIVEAGLVGYAADDIVQVHKRRPPAGTPVLVGGQLRMAHGPWTPTLSYVPIDIAPGHPDLDTTTIWLIGERARDGSILIPDRIKVLGPSALETSIRVHLQSTTPYTELRVPYLDFSFQKDLIMGTIQYLDGMVMIAATRWIHLVSDPAQPYNTPELHERFPWVDETSRTRVLRKVLESDRRRRTTSGDRDSSGQTHWPGGSTRYSTTDSASNGFYGAPSHERATVLHPLASMADDA